MMHINNNFVQGKLEASAKHLISTEDVKIFSEQPI